ncbi:MAG: tetratricopeptide repeat protein [Verrucomicrobiales bacterium]|nr:tetratricopeptide repeat protein [Verrucomicrobiales bacterium]
MDPIPLPYSHHLSAAQGWLELGTAAEAANELAAIKPPWDKHPAVLEISWGVNAKLKNWERCVALANELIADFPEHEAGWIHRSYALHELQRTREALEMLAECSARFPRSTTIPYNLACYHAQLAQLDAARDWLEKAFARSEDPKVLKVQALQDPDLKLLHAEIQKKPR